MKLNHARILLTGASGGLGRALARALVDEGADILLAGRDPARLQAMLSSIGSAGSQVETVIADLDQTEGVERVADAARAFGINVLINNAGINAFGLFSQQDWRTVAGVLETNLLAPIRITHSLLPLLEGRGEAAIVNIGSTFGSLPFPGFAAYSTAKAGLKGFSQALRRELADSRVKVVFVAPRAIETPLNTSAVNALNQALGSKSDTTESVARQIVAALREDKSEVHFGFPERLFAWLNGWAPSLIDKALRTKLPIVKHHASFSGEIKS